MMRMTRIPVFFSTSSCDSFMRSSPAFALTLRRRSGRNGNMRIHSASARERHADALAQDQNSGKKQHAAEKPHGIVRIGRLHAFDERIGERAVRVHRAPHE